MFSDTSLIFFRTPFFISFTLNVYPCGSSYTTISRFFPFNPYGIFTPHDLRSSTCPMVVGCLSRMFSDILWSCI